MVEILLTWKLLLNSFRKQMQTQFLMIKGHISGPYTMLRSTPKWTHLGLLEIHPELLNLIKPGSSPTIRRRT